MGYQDSDFESLIQFLKANWSEQHAIYDKALFDWQYRIHEGNLAESLLLKDNDEIVGFLGNIPGEYNVFGEHCKGVAFAMWIVDEKYRNSGLGILLLKEAEKNNQVTLTLGCNLQVAPMYERMGYSYSDHLNRYVLPLDSKGYSRLLNTHVDGTVIDQWTERINSSLTAPMEPNKDVKMEQLEQLYRTSIQENFLLTQNRNAEFWQWRYLNSPGYQYTLFGNPSEEGIAVVRIDSVHSLEEEELHGLNILRLIELIPANGEVWNGESDPSFTQLIRGVLAWAKKRGCVAADYQLSSNRLEHVLLGVGFNIQHIDYTPDECGLAGLFQPFRYRVSPINLVWKIKSTHGNVERIDVNDTYFVKSDGDMDRPNALPKPKDGTLHE